MNNLLRVILGVRWVDWRPEVNTVQLYKENNLLKLGNIFRLHLFKLLKQLLDGKFPDIYSLLLEPHLSTRVHETRNSLFRHPALRCEVERRFLPHQLITLFEQVNPDLLNLSENQSVRHFIANSQSYGMVIQ